MQQFTLTLALLIITSVGYAEGNPALAEESVTIFNWAEYIPDDVLTNFTRETGIKVNYQTYKNNEVMYTKLKLLKGRGYDVLVPSTYMVERLRNDGLLQPIDKTLLPNFKNLDLQLLNKPYDPNNEMSIPYLWGSVGIGVNPADPDTASISAWADLWNNKWRGKLLLLDDMRSIFHMALRLDHHSTNSTSPEEIKLAYDRLQKLLPNVKVIETEHTEKLFADGTVNVGVTWSGDVILAQQQQAKLQYIYPKEGASFWMDSFVIPSGASHVENAHKFIDYLLRPEVAALCVKELGYATPNLEAKKLLDTTLQANPAIFPPAEVLEKAEFQRDIGNAQVLYTKYWEKLKASLH